MIKFLAKVLVGSVGVYALNRYFERTKFLEKSAEVGTMVLNNALSQVAQAYAAKAEAAKAQASGGAQ